MRSSLLTLALVAALATTPALPARANDPDATAEALAAAFKALCLETALSQGRLRAAWPGTVKDGAVLTQRPIDAATPDPQARPGAPKPAGAVPAEPRIRIDGKLALPGAAFVLAAVVPKGGDRLDACRIEASVEGIDGVVAAVVTSLGLTEPKVVAASQSSTYLNDPDPTIFKYVAYAPSGGLAVTIGLELKPHGRGNLLLIAEPAAAN